MKYLALGALAISCAASSRAATLSMSLGDVDIPNRTAVIDVNVDMVVGDSLSLVFFALEPYSDVIHVLTLTDIPNWSVGEGPSHTNLPLGQSQFAVAADLVIADNAIHGPGLFTVGSIVLALPDDLSSFPIELAFNTMHRFGIFDDFTSAYDFNPSYVAYSGYFTFGKGSPGYTQMSSSVPRDPLILTPEPISLGYLGLAAFAMILRRRSS